MVIEKTSIPGPGAAMALAAGLTGLGIGNQQNSSIAWWMLILAFTMVISAVFIEIIHFKKK